MKTGRNEPCPCGSGNKYKRCCGAMRDTQARHSSQIIPPEVLQAFARQEEERLARKNTFGDVKGMITAEMGEWRFVASGNKLVYGKDWRVFTDFLGFHLHGLLGEDWGQHQVKLPFEEQHTVIQWRTIIALAHFGKEKGANGLYKSASGAANAWFRLAYDLYLIEHNAELQSKLLRRMRNQDGFQGARFEAAVAAMMLASGYELRYCDERGPGRQPEFIATNRSDSHILAVEAKSRHRPGVMGFRKHDVPVPPDSFDIAGLLLAALMKDTEEPLLVFVELNTPMAIKLDSSTTIYGELERAWDAVQERNWPDGFPAIGVVFYNDASPWYLDKSLPEGLASIWALALWPKASRHNFDAKSLLSRIAQGCVQRATIPLDFPSSS